MATKRRLTRVAYTVPEVASMLGLSDRTIREMCRNDDIPAAKVGNSRLFLIPADWVDALNAGTMGQWLAAMESRNDEPTRADAASAESVNPERSDDSDLEG